MLFKSLHNINGLIIILGQTAPLREQNSISEFLRETNQHKSPTMEISNDSISWTESKAKARAKSWKPPTRLQAQAPASLQLDQMAFSACTSVNCLPATDPSMAIPLLSPLILSPQPLQETTERLICAGDQSKRDGVADKANIRGSPESGWQHPAVATFTDPSTLFSFFQSQCVIVNPAQ